MFCKKSREDERRYAYEKAIEAYWKHVDRYHTWMNYYALFNGALFVGFCTLLTATTKVSKKANDVFELTNNYEVLQIILCIVGLISAIAWLCSICGHEKWEMNWMNIIEYYENRNFRVYNLLIAGEEFMKVKNADNHKLKFDEYFKAYSTHKITINFVWYVICGWSVCLLYSLCNIFKCVLNNFLVESGMNRFCFGISSLCFIIIVYVFFIFFVRSILGNGFYSNVKGKYWINKK